MALLERKEKRETYIVIIMKKKIHVFVKYSLILNSKKKKYSLILLFNNNLIKIKGRNGI